MNLAVLGERAEHRRALNVVVDGAVRQRSQHRSAERRFEVQAGGFVKVPDHMLAKIVRSAQEIVGQQRAGHAHIDDNGVKSIEIELDLAELVDLDGRQKSEERRVGKEGESTGISMW